MSNIYSRSPLSRIGGLGLFLGGNSTDSLDSAVAVVVIPAPLTALLEEVGVFLVTGGLDLPFDLGAGFPFDEEVAPGARTPSSSSPTVIATVAAADDKEPICKRNVKKSVPT